MIVKYGSTCDASILCTEHGSGCGQKCGRRSAEGARWPTCSECRSDTCPAHAVAGSLDDESGRVLCTWCAYLDSVGATLLVDRREA